MFSILIGILPSGALPASVDHPGIVKVLRSFGALGTADFVMPFVEGMALDELILSRRQIGRDFSEEELRGLLERTLDALSHLHDHGIYHRNLTPGNILITHEVVPVLIDFGSARQRLSERSMTGIESPAYMPFEQLQSRGNVGPWSDLYALGGTLCKVLTDEAPPKAMDRMRRDPFVPLASRGELSGRFSAGFLGQIDKALAVEECERWQDAAEWRAALEARSEVRRRVGDNASSAQEPAAGRVRAQPTRAGKSKVGPWILAACGVRRMVVWGVVVSNQQGASEQRAQKEEVAPPNARAEETARNAEMGSRPGEERDFEIAPGVMLRMCWIPPGEFLMGSPADELGRSGNTRAGRGRRGP